MCRLPPSQRRRDTHVRVCELRKGLAEGGGWEEGGECSANVTRPNVTNVRAKVGRDRMWRMYVCGMYLKVAGDENVVEGGAAAEL